MRCISQDTLYVGCGQGPPQEVPFREVMGSTRQDPRSFGYGYGDVNGYGHAAALWVTAAAR